MPEPIAIRRDEGAAAVEYGLLVVAVAALIVVVVFALGRMTQAGYNDACTELKAQVNSADSCS